jgi:hypothetical protein
MMSDTVAATRLNPSRLLAWLGVRPGDAEEKARRKARLADAKAEAQFLSKLKAVEAALQALAPLPGIDGQLAAVTTAVQGARTLGELLQYAAALAALERLDDPIKQARADSARANRAAQRHFPELMAAAAQLQADISGQQREHATTLRRRDDPRNRVGDPAVRLPSADKAAYLQRLGEELRPLYQPNAAQDAGVEETRAAVHAGLTRLDIDVWTRAAQNRDDERQATELLRTATGRLGELRQRVPAADFAVLSRDYQTIRTLYGAGDFGPALDALRPLVERLNAAVLGAGTALETWRTRKGQVQALQDEARTLTARMRTLVPVPPDLSETMGKLESLRPLTADPEPTDWPYSEALARLDECENALQDLRANWDAARTTAEQWVERAVRLAELCGESEALAARTDVPLLVNVAPVANETLDKLRRLRDFADQAEPELDRLSYADAVSLFDECDVEVQTQRHRVTAYAAQHAARANADQQVRQAVAAVEAALDARSQRLQADGGPPETTARAVIGRLHAQLTELTATWTSRMDTAETVADLLVGEMVGALNSLATDAANLGLDGLVARSNDMLLAEARRRFDQLATHVRTTIGAFALLDTDRSDTYATGLDEFTAEAAHVATVADLARLETRLRTFQREVGDTLAQQRNVAATLQGGLAAKVAWVETRLTAFSALIEPNKEPQYGAMRDTFRTMLDGQRWVIGVTQASVLRAAEPPLDELAGHIDAAIAAVKAGGSVKHGVVSIKSFLHQLDELHKVLEHRTMRTYLRVTQGRLFDQVATLKSSVPAMPLTDGAAAIEACRRAVTEARTRADQRKADYAGFENTVRDDARRRLGDPLLRDASDYRGAKRKELESLLAVAREEDGMDPARQELAAWVGDFDQVLADPAGRLLERQNAARDAAAQAEVNRVRWNSYHDDFIKRVKALTPLLSSTPTRTVFDRNRTELEQLAKAADKAFRTTGDIDLALTQLQVARERADYLERYPQGTELTMRGNLPHVAARWRDAVGTLTDGFRSLETAVERAGDDVPADVLAMLRRTLTDMRVRFNPAAFDAPVRDLTDPALPAARKASIREAALRTVRRLHAAIEDDIRMMDLANNPFHPDLRGDIANARSVLLDMETNLLGCL